MAVLDDTLTDLRQTVAALERKLGERTAERDEALAQQTATAEVLQVINSSPGDLAPVFDAMLEKAIRLCDGVVGVLWTLDGERGHPAASRGLPAEYIALHWPARVTPVLQQADCTAAELRRSGGHRDGERAAVDRDP